MGFNSGFKGLITQEDVLCKKINLTSSVLFLQLFQVDDSQFGSR